MATTKNIFDILDAGQDSEEEQDSKSKTQKQKEAPKRAPIDAKVDEYQKENRKKTEQKNPQKEKGVSDQPHPLDRKSGTKYDGAMQKNNFRKGGAGKGNYGTLKDELRGDAPEGEPTENDDGQAAEQAPTFKTIDQYYRDLGVEQRQDETQEEKNIRHKTEKELSEQLKKDKLSYLKTKEEIRQVEALKDNQSKKSKKNTRLDYKATFESEHTNLLGFKTGTVIVEDGLERKPKREFQDRDQKDRPYRPRKDEKTGEEQAAKEPEAATQEPKAEEGAAEVKQEPKQGGERRGNDQRGEYRGGNRGDKPYPKRDRQNQGAEGEQQQEGEGRRGGERRQNDNRGERRDQGEKRGGDRPQRGGERRDNNNRGAPERGADRGAADKPRNNGNSKSGKGFVINEKEDFPTLG